MYSQRRRQRSVDVSERRNQQPQSSRYNSFSLLYNGIKGRKGLEGSVKSHSPIKVVQQIEALAEGTVPESVI
jgi:hypothetical protein